MAKDNFSSQSKEYALFRPTFPDKLYEFIARQSPSRGLTWDVATGNGQSAIRLKNYFEKVIATDVSSNQLEHAVCMNGVEYRKETAENSSLENNSVDLVNVSQAIHWFKFDSFYKEVRRVAKPRAVIAAYCYSLFSTTDDSINDLIRQFYIDSAPYWDYERKYVDDGYATIPFPFEEIESPSFNMAYQWTIEQLLGYIGTWSATHRYLKQEGKNMVSPGFEKLLSGHWPPHGTLQVTFPVRMRIGRV